MTDRTCDDILYGKLRLFQPLNGPRVNIDTVLLSAFAKIKRGEKVIELGSAHGAISLLLALRFPGAGLIEGLEIQEDLWELGKENIHINNLETRVSFTHGDLRNIRDLYKAQSFDVVVVNPPYFDGSRTRPSPDKSSAVANHGISCSLQDVITAARFLLRNKGRLYLIFNAGRMDELMSLLCDNRLMTKRVRPVYPSPGKKASVVLLSASNNAGEGLVLDSPLIVFDEKGKYTEELLRAYEVENSPCL